jgi:GT2 family glycosyltransferase
MDVSIIIVNYNTKSLLRDCLESIYKHTEGIEFEIIVSDNGSSDGSDKMIKSEYPGVILLENGANLGFGAANNRALAAAGGRYIFYLNSDTVLLNNAVKIFHDFWENHGDREGLGALGCSLLDKNFRPAHSYGSFPELNGEILWLCHNIASGLVKMILTVLPFGISAFKGKKPDGALFFGCVDYITGADLFLKNDKTAYFDERYFLYVEEIDLEFNLRKHNKQRMIIEGPAIMHLGGGSDIKSAPVNFAKESNVYISLSKLIFFNKHYGRNGIRLFILKLLTLIWWLNPLLLPMSRRHFKELSRLR